MSSILSHLDSFLVENKVDLALITNCSTLFYLTGFNASYGLLLATKKRKILFLDGRYLELARNSSLFPKEGGRSNGREFLNIEFQPLDIPSIITIVKATNSKKIVVDEQSPLIKKILSNFAPLPPNHQSSIINHQFPLIDFSILRQIKSPEEIQKIAKACELTDETLKLFVKNIKYGMAERDLHLLWRKSMLDAGGLDYAFDPIIGINAGSSYPHYMLMGKAKLTPKSIILVDSGVAYEGYKSDMTRMLFMPEAPQKIQKYYQQVLNIQETILSSIQIGGKITDTMRLCDELLEKAGLKGKMMHSLGHGVGLDVHEEPYYRKDSQAVWQENMVIAVEPGIYFPGKFGIRIEDTGVITKKGVISLTKFPKKLSQIIAHPK